MNRIRPIQKAKNILRKQLVDLLVSMSQTERNRQSAIIHEKLFKLPQFVKARRIACYCSMVNEVDTRPIMEKVFQLNKRLYVPRYSYRYKQMYMERLNDLNDYDAVLQRKGVIRPQPRYSDYREDAMDVGGLHVIIVNGLAFTKNGKRLGTGGGYYDTYIKNHSRAGFKKFTTIGLAFTEQIFPYIPTHIHDVNVNIVIYPR